MLNQCQFLGNLGADPEVRSFQDGKRVCNMRIAVTEKWKDRTSGERKERTEWVPISIFNDGLVGIAERYLRKGSKIFIQGQFRTRKWTAQDGSDRYTTEIVLQGPDALLMMLDGPEKGSGSNRAQEPHPGAHGGDNFDDDDGPPF